MCPRLDVLIVGPIPGGVKHFEVPESPFVMTVNNSEKEEGCTWYIVVPHQKIMSSPHYELGYLSRHLNYSNRMSGGHERHTGTSYYPSTFPSVAHLLQTVT
jgi:hypothetical protein